VAAPVAEPSAIHVSNSAAPATGGGLIPVLLGAAFALTLVLAARALSRELRGG
jgi:hypothetical protein